MKDMLGILYDYNIWRRRSFEKYTRRCIKVTKDNLEVERYNKQSKKQYKKDKITVPKLMKKHEYPNPDVSLHTFIHW